METAGIGNSKPLSTAATSPTTCHRRSQRPIRRGAGRFMSRSPAAARSWFRALIFRDGNKPAAQLMTIRSSEDPVGARNPAPLCSRHVWPRPSLLRCQRDQASLLHPAASPHPEHRAELARRANRPAAGGPLRQEATSRLLDGVLRRCFTKQRFECVSINFSVSTDRPSATSRRVRSGLAAGGGSHERTRLSPIPWGKYREFH